MKLLGIDYGEKYVGLAISTDGYILPVGHFSYKKNHQLETELLINIKNIIETENISRVIVGLPIYKKNETVLGREIREFINKLRNKVKNIEFIFVDEFNTSNEAVKEQISYNISKNKRQKEHDFSAAKILQRYLDSTSEYD